MALAVGGNMVTAWTLFGVNLLSIGLHSYGFMQGTLWALLVFWTSQLYFDHCPGFSTFAILADSVRTNKSYRNVGC